MSTLTATDTVSLPLAMRRFALHFVEMCVVMCAGGYALCFAVFAVAGQLGFPDLVARAPELSILIVAVDFALVMATYMAVRGHAVQHNIEMSGSAVIGSFGFIAAIWLGLIARAPLATWHDIFSLTCGPLCGLMLLVMLVRFDHYGGRVGASVATVATETGAYTCSMHPEVRRAAPGRCPICGMTLVRRD